MRFPPSKDSSLCPCLCTVIWVGLLHGSNGEELPPPSHPEDITTRIIENLLFQSKMFEKQSDSLVTESEGREGSLFYSQAFPVKVTSKADINSLNETFHALFSRQRSDEYNATLKEETREGMVKRLTEYGLKVMSQKFSVRSIRQSIVYRGSNIIGILPGKHRGTDDDSITVIGAHYDTVKLCPGVDDNGSGSAAVLETARVVTSSRGKDRLNHTLIFALFDLEELGALGSLAFVNHYLIKQELFNKKVRFNGAYILDMILNVDRNQGSQDLPQDIDAAVPGVKGWLERNAYRGDFLAVWMRKDVEEHLLQDLRGKWLTEGRESSYKLLALDPPLSPVNPTLKDLLRFSTFLRSDHSSFWYHRYPGYNSTLDAVLLTDMGPWRGLQKVCYHSFCDDVSQLTDDNLGFLKHTVDVLINVVTNEG